MLLPKSSCMHTNIRSIGARFVWPNYHFWSETNRKGCGHKKALKISPGDTDSKYI